MRKILSSTIIGILCLGIWFNNVYADSVVGTEFTSVNSSPPVISPNGRFVIYTNWDSGGDLYKKGINDIGDGTLFTSVISVSPIISKDGSFVIYVNGNDNKLYKKGINDGGDGTEFTSVISSFPLISPDGSFVIYKNRDSGGHLYKKGINDSGDGTQFTSVNSDYPTISPDGSFVIYNNRDSGGHLYKKGINDSGDGAEFTSVSSDWPTISKDGSFVIYINRDSGGHLYKKRINEVGNGTQFTSVSSYSISTTISPDGSFVIYLNWDNGKLYKIELIRDPTGNTTTGNIIANTAIKIPGMTFLTFPDDLKSLGFTGSTSITSNGFRDYIKNNLGFTNIASTRDNSNESKVLEYNNFLSKSENIDKISQCKDICYFKTN